MKTRDPKYGKQHLSGVAVNPRPEGGYSIFCIEKLERKESSGVSPCTSHSCMHGSTNISIHLPRTADEPLHGCQAESDFARAQPKYDVPLQIMTRDDPHISLHMTTIVSIAHAVDEKYELHRKEFFCLHFRQIQVYFLSVLRDNIFDSRLCRHYNK